LMTIYMSFSVYFCFKRCEQKWSQLTIPALVTVGHTGAALIVMHYLNNTLNLFKTVAAPLAVATFYSLFLSWKYYSELKLKESVS